MEEKNDKKEDLLLVQECLNGNKEAFGKLIEKYKTPIHNMAFRMMGCPEEAHDAAQESFLRAYKALKSYRVEYSFFTWLYTISLNVCRNSLKRKKIVTFFSINSSGRGDEDKGNIDLPDNKMNPELLYEQKRKADIIQKAITKLPVKYKSIVIARFIDGLSYEEIACIEKIPLGTVKTQLHRAKKILVTYLRKQKQIKQIDGDYENEGL